MDGLLNFLARTGDKFDKDEIYTFLAGLFTGTTFYTFFAKELKVLIGEISFANPLFYLSVISTWLLLTALIYLIENTLIILFCIIFWIKTRKTDWTKKASDYKKSESQVRHLNEFSQLTFGMHLWGLIAAAFIVLFFTKHRIAESLGLCLILVGMVFVSGFLISSIMVFRTTYKWLTLERLFLIRAFVVVQDINVFLNYYGPAPEQLPSQESEAPPQSPS